MTQSHRRTPDYPPDTPPSRRHIVYEFFIGTFLARPTDGWRAANGFTTSRKHSMKSLVTGLRVRFFRVMIPTGQGGLGKSTGKILSGGRCVPSCSKDTDIARTNGPLARSAKSK